MIPLASKLTGSALVLIFWLPATAQAHVKWFSRFGYDQAPQGLSQLNNPTFWSLLALTVVTLALFVYLDRKLETWEPYRKLDQKLRSYEEQAPVILRIFTGASLLLAWQGDSMIAPELKIPSQAVGWYQFGLCLLLLGRFTSAFAGAGMIALYLYAITQYGMFHMLDYLVYPAIGYFLLVSNAKELRIRSSRVPALYLGLGFSLCWAALEKIFYPNWGLEVLQQAPGLTMGLPHEFFLLSCAFVELSLGYLLIIGLIQRPLALTITLVFFTTTAFFGKTEVVGHTLLHGALLVFIVLGTGGYYKPPIALHRNLGLRMAFASVNFVIVLALLGGAYHALSSQAYERQTETHSDGHDHSSHD
jgi:uncharacterized membrane protein YphA (DoxX/SURF4 family)